MLITTGPDFAARICFARKTQLLSQGRAAQLLGISQPSLCCIEKGKRQPSMELLRKLQRVYGRACYRYAMGLTNDAPPKRQRNKLATPRKPYTRKVRGGDAG